MNDLGFFNENRYSKNAKYEVQSKSSETLSDGLPTVSKGDTSWIQLTKADTNTQQKEEGEGLVFDNQPNDPDESYQVTINFEQKEENQLKQSQQSIPILKTRPDSINVNSSNGNIGQKMSLREDIHQSKAHRTNHMSQVVNFNYNSTGDVVID